VIASLVILGFAGAWWALDKMSKKADENDAYGVFVTATKQTAPAQEAWRKEQQAEKDRVRRGMEVFRAYFTKVLTRGDEKMADQLVQLILSVDAEHEKLCTDADRDNDPKDYQAFFRERLRVLAEENKVVHHWLGGKSPDIILEAVFGRPAEPERGETAEFLRQGGYRGNGTGFCVSPDGWIITNEHVVDDAGTVDVRGADGRILQAQVVDRDPERDLALLRINEKTAAWLAVDPVPLAMGDSVFTIGFPRATQQGVEPKFIDGRVSSLTGFRDERDRYQTTVPVGPGNSGGALVNAKNGSVAGVIVARLSGDNVSYAVKSAELADLMKKVSGASLPPSASGESALIERTRLATYLVLVK
jgi:S1-C subfamily serine protease